MLICASCKENKMSGFEGDSGLSTNEKTLVTEKQELKGKIFKLYPKLLNVSFNSNDTINYAKYSEFLEMENLISKYESLTLDKKEIQRTGIFKAKIFILISNYQEAIKTISELPKDNSFQLYKKLLISISNDYSSNKNSNEAYDEIISNLLNENDVDCEKYLMTLVLSGKKDLKACVDFRKQLNFLNKLGKDKLVEEYILGVNEL